MGSLMIHLTLDTYIELVERSKKAGIKPGESMQPILDEMIKEGKVERIIKTSRSQDEVKKDLKKHWKILDLTEEEK